MRTLFVDTLYWVGLANRRDQWHQWARQMSRSLGSVRLVTTEEVLVEFLTSLCAEGAAMRASAVRVVRAMRSNPNLEIRPQTPDSFAAGLELYERRLDKSYSMTDCLSMATMRALGLTEVLTRDRHFEQEGFRLVL